MPRALARIIVYSRELPGCSSLGLCSPRTAQHTAETATGSPGRAGLPKQIHKEARALGVLGGAGDGQEVSSELEGEEGYGFSPFQAQARTPDPSDLKTIRAERCVRQVGVRCGWRGGRAGKVGAHWL